MAAAVKKDLELSNDEELNVHIRNWMRWDRNAKTLEQIVNAVEEKNWDTLRERLCRRIAFGTAGLRACMRAGFDSMNDLTVLQTAQGLCEYIMEAYPSRQRHLDQGVVFGYDGRYNSKRYAEISSAVFLNAGFKVYMFRRVVATPFVPYSITYLKCLAGVMVTASHNPKEDNGYKVYWTNGTQIISPVDKGIHASILKNLEPKPSSWDTEGIYSNTNLKDPYTTIFPEYYKSLLKYIPLKYQETNECSQLRFVYTAMHGVGYPYVKEAFYQAKLKPVIAVKEQRDPDPEFRTVKYPNPEEGKSALDLAIQLANDVHVTTILANDPDADRLAIAELDPRGKWKIFNGNELGAILGWWALENYRARTEKPDLGNCVMIASTVSSKILASMAAIEGFIFVETLTGFKWMGNKAVELTEKGKNVLLAFEESIGYMFSMNVIDKDGVSAATHVATMASYLRTTRRITLIEKLHEIYDTYGFHCTNNSYYICTDQEVIRSLFDRLRTYEDDVPGSYPKCIMNGQYEIKTVRDLTTGFDSEYPDRRARLPVSSSTQMITFTFTNGMVLTLRTSGTEPKIKYYAEMCGLPEEKDWDELRDRLKIMTDGAIEEFLQPKENNLKPKP